MSQSNNQNETVVVSSSTAATTTASMTETYGRVPVGFMALIYGAMKDASQYELDQMKAFSKYMQDASMQYADQIGMQVDLEVESADDTRRAAKDEAEGMFISAGIAGGLSVATAGMGVRTWRNNGSLDAQEADRQAFNNSLKPDNTQQPGNEQGVGSATRTGGTATPDATDQKITEISTNKQSLKEFIESPNNTEKTDVIDRLKANDAKREAVLKNSEGLGDSYRSQQGQYNDTYRNFSMQSQMWNEIGKDIAQGCAKTASAKDAQAAAEEQAYAKAVEQNNATFNATIADAQQKANSNENDAFSIAAAYAQIKG